MGLVSGGGVHSDLGHLKACLELAAREHVPRRRRARLPRRARHAAAQRPGLPRRGPGAHGRGSASAATASVAAATTPWTATRAGTAIKLAYDALVYGEGFFAADAQAAVEAAYRAARPTSSCGPRSSRPSAAPACEDGDVCLFFNFRPDRARELTRAFFEKDFAEFDRGPHPPAVDFVTMTEYKKEFPLPVAFPPEHPRHVLADVLAEHGLRQLHIAETEKYAHVTFFFNGGVEKAVPGRGAHPRAQPARRAHLRPQAGDERPAASPTSSLRQLEHGRRTTSSSSTTPTPTWSATPGIIEAAVAAVETVDACLGRVVDARHARSAASASITADHGNSDNMLEPDGSPNTAHSTNLVPFVATVDGVRVREGGRLCDLAPTVLALLGLAQPPEMTGVPLAPAVPP